MKKITSTELAKLAKVSQSTVSFVLNNNTNVKISAETRNRVINLAKEYGYGPFAEKNAGEMMDEVVVILPTFINPYYPMLLSLIVSELQLNNLRCVVCCTDKDINEERKILETYDRYQTRALLYTFTPQAKEEAKKFAQSHPLFVLCEVDYDINATIVALNSKKAGMLAIDHLASLGHKNIAFISNAIDKLSISRRERLEGIQTYAHNHNIYVKVFTVPDNIEYENELDLGYLLTQEVINDPMNFTAIIAANDYTAIGSINAIMDAGLSIPEDFSIMGFDNLEISKTYHPPITTIDHNLFERVQLAIELLISKRNKSQQIFISYDPILIARDSTGEIKKS